MRASLIDFGWPGKERSALRRGRDEQFFHSQGQADDDRDPREFIRSGGRSASPGGGSISPCFQPASTRPKGRILLVARDLIEPHHGNNSPHDQTL